MNGPINNITIADFQTSSTFINSPLSVQIASTVHVDHPFGDDVTEAQIQEDLMEFYADCIPVPRVGNKYVYNRVLYSSLKKAGFGDYYASIFVYHYRDSEQMKKYPPTPKQLIEEMGITNVRDRIHIISYLLGNRGMHTMNGNIKWRKKQKDIDIGFPWEYPYTYQNDGLSLGDMLLGCEPEPRVYSIGTLLSMQYVNNAILERPEWDRIQEVNNYKEKTNTKIKPQMRLAQSSTRWVKKNLEATGVHKNGQPRHYFLRRKAKKMIKKVVKTYGQFTREVSKSGNNKELLKGFDILYKQIKIKPWKLRFPNIKLWKVSRGDLNLNYQEMEWLSQNVRELKSNKLYQWYNKRQGKNFEVEQANKVVQKLLCNERLMVMFGDKSHNIWITDIKWYREQINKHMEDMYDELTEAEEKQCSKEYLNYMYLTMKDHKKPFKGQTRPIVAAYPSDSVKKMKRIAKRLTNEIITKINNKNKHCKIVRDQVQFTKYYEVYSKHVPLDIKGDVEGMYNNLPKEGVLRQVQKICSLAKPNERDKIEKYILSSFVLNRDKLYIQKKGCKMGNMFSPIIAQMYIMEKCNPEDVVLLYVDDMRTTPSTWLSMRIKLFKEGVNLTLEDRKIHLGLNYDDPLKNWTREQACSPWQDDDPWQENKSNMYSEIMHNKYFNYGKPAYDKNWRMLMDTKIASTRSFYYSMKEVLKPSSCLDMRNYIKLLKQAEKIQVPPARYENNYEW